MSQSSSKYSRRSFLARVGLGGAALPLLEAEDAFGGCLAQPPKRVLFLVYPNGADGATSYITGSETDFTLPGFMKSPLSAGGPTLESLRSEMIFVDGVRNNSGEAASHETRPTVFTGVKLTLNDGDANHRVIPGGPSIDQVMAAQLLQMGVKTLRPTLNLAVRSDGYRASYRTKDDPVQPEQDPFKLLSALFGGKANGPSTDAAQAGLWKARKLVLDQKARELDAWKRTLGKPDQIIVDSWVASLADLQRELMTPAPANGAGCGAPALGNLFDVTATENHAKVLKAQMDIAIAALAADVSRIAMIEVDNSWGDHTVMTWLGSGFENGSKQDTANGNNHHHLAHENGARKTKIDTWYAGMWAYLIDAMARYREGNGSLLDNTVVVIANDGRNGAAHSTTNVPWLLAGGKALGFRGGRYLKVNNTPHRQLLCAVANAVGVPMATFGGEGQMAGLR